jgi:hypothetical protein
MTFGPWARSSFRRASIVVLALVAPSPGAGQAPVYVPEEAVARIHPLPTLRSQAEEQQAWLQLRLERVLPELMTEYGVDMWVLSMREYAEDPVFWSMISPTTFAARRRSIYVFTRRPDGTVERIRAASSRPTDRLARRRWGRRPSCGAESSGPSCARS